MIGGERRIGRAQPPLHSNAICQATLYLRCVCVCVYRLRSSSCFAEDFRLWSISASVPCSISATGWLTADWKACSVCCVDSPDFPASELLSLPSIFWCPTRFTPDCITRHCRTLSTMHIQRQERDSLSLSLAVAGWKKKNTYRKEDSNSKNPVCLITGGRFLERFPTATEAQQYQIFFLPSFLLL